MNSLKDITDIIKKSQNTAIVCHKNPDGDTLGSAFALSKALDKINKNNAVFCSDELPDKYYFMDKIELNHKIDTSLYDLVIFTDIAAPHLIGSLFDEIHIDELNSVNIDHHGTNSMYAKVNAVKDSYSSTAEVILELIHELDVEPDKEIAEYLYTGILTDTGQFAYSYTSGRTLRYAAELMECEVDTSWLNKVLFNTIPLSKLQLTKRMLDNVLIIEKLKTGITLLSSEDFEKSGATAQESDSLVNMILSVDVLDIAVLIRQIDNETFKASFRSSDHIDISKAAKLLGGGGHKQASGATFNCKKEDAVNMALNAIKEADLIK